MRPFDSRPGVRAVKELRVADRAQAIVKAREAGPAIEQV
jgi:hypothetical protein